MESEGSSILWMELSQIVKDEIFRPLGDFVVVGIDFSSHATPKVELIGDSKRSFFLASVSKLLSSVGLLVGYEEGLFEYNTTVSPLDVPLNAADLLSHASGLPFDLNGVVSKASIDSLLQGEIPFDASLIVPRLARRIYSNLGFELVCSFVERQSTMAHFDYLQEAIFKPLSMTSVQVSEKRFSESGPTGGSARMKATAEDLIRLAFELHSPTLFQESTLRLAASSQYEELSGILPGFGRYEKNTFGFGFEVHGNKVPHWMSSATSPNAFGHFGASGTFMWLDPLMDKALIFLGENDFGIDHRRLWPILSERFVTS